MRTFRLWLEDAGVGAPRLQRNLNVAFRRALDGLRNRAHGLIGVAAQVGGERRSEAAANHGRRHGESELTENI